MRWARCGTRGSRAGLFRPQTVWPFPIRSLLPLLGQTRRIVVVEASPGQLEDELRLALSHAGAGAGIELRHVRRGGGVLPSQREIVDAVRASCAKEVTGVSVFYERFDRHDHGAGLKARSTHHCPGCGHGLVQRYLSEAIDRLGLQERTVAVSPVGCGVFLYYYLDVGNTQAAHGRASAVALGHKLANPSSVVVSYQGDGDLASIGLTEILHVAQLGVPISVVFVNNAVYGMTGGQLAPTTLLGQRTTTSPEGRDRTMGQPLKMAELIAQLDGPVYVERVALFDAKQRRRAAKAIEKALALQARDAGFSFVEVLSECPVHLRATPQEAERFVREQMLPVFPLGVKKDVPGESWASAWRTPVFEADALLGASARAPSRRRASARGSRARASATRSGSSWPAPGATAPRPSPRWWREPRSTRASTPRTSRATGPSRGAGRPSPTCGSPRRGALARRDGAARAGGLQRAQPGPLRAVGPAGRGGGPRRLGHPRRRRRWPPRCAWSARRAPRSPESSGRRW